jgi:hypothetical protein
MRFLNLIVTCALFLSTNILNAEWDPAFLSLETTSVNEVLNNQNFIECEKKVCDYLKGSWCTEDKSKLIMELIVLTRPKICVEIGVFTGSTALPILESLKYTNNGKAYLIDAWSTRESIKGLPGDDLNTIWWSSLDMKEIKNLFIQMINNWGLESYCKIVNAPSVYASNIVPEINFLHLDGNFSESGSLKDCEVFLPKVVSGGYILVSNVLIMIGGKPTKMKTLWPLFDQCEIVCEIDHGNTILFRKE